MTRLLMIYKQEIRFSLKSNSNILHGGDQTPESQGYTYTIYIHFVV